MTKMNQTRKLSLFLSFALLMQLSLPASGWTNRVSSVTAAPGGPVEVSLSPADNLTEVPLGANLVLTFDEPVRAGSSTAFISIYKSSNNSLVETISATSGQVSVNYSNPSEVTINPSLSATSNKFELNTAYYVLIDAGAFVNVSNSAAYAGIQNATRWNFRTVLTEDNVRPTYTTRSPEGGTHAITSPISLTFSEPVYAAAGFITLSSADDTRYIPVTSGNVTGSGTNTMTIVPEGALLPNTTYTATIASDNFQDASGNTFAGMSWSFSTASAPVNLASSLPFTPADDATLVPIDMNLTIRFDQPIQAGSSTKYIEIRRVSDNSVVERIQANSSRVTLSNGNTTATIDPVSNLAASTAYYIVIDPGAFTRPSPNTAEWFYGISAATIWNFTTGYGNDVTAPVLTGVTPTYNGTASGMSTLLTLTFNEEVYPNSGNIEIRQSVGGTLFRSIPITSARVTGGGTKQLIVDPNKYISSSDPAKSFVNNTRYYVTIGNRAIRDGAGNFYSGISSATGWTFTITQDGVRPMLQSLSPANGSTAVPVQSQFSAIFDKPIMTGPGGIAFYPASANSSAPTVAGTFGVDPANNKRIIITPSQPLAANTNYYVNIEENAVLDLVGNSFIGIQNTYQWTFLTMGGDTTAPTVSKSEVSGSIIRLIYNEPLNPDLKPSPASYYVTVAGAPRNVTAVKVEGNMVVLTLASSAGSNQKVILSYTRPATGLVQDVSGNQAATISNMEVSNGSTSTAPVVTSGSAYGSTVVLNFSEALMTVSTYAYTQFTVNVGGNNYSPTSIWHSGNVIQMTVNASMTTGQTVRVSYSPISYPLIGVSGNTVGAFSNYTLNGSGTGGGAGDNLSPNVLNITASGTLVSIKYNEALSLSTAPATYQYSITADGSTRSVSNVILSGDTVFLTLTASVTTGQNIRVSYIGTSNTVTDYKGNAAASFTNIAANSGTGTGTGQPGTMKGAILKGQTLTLSFNEPLNPTIVPASSLFLVRVKEMVRAVSNVQISGQSVILTLTTPANVGESATISYFANTSGLVTLGGQSVSGFTNANVANQTTLLDTLTGDYEASEGGGIAIKYTGASISTDTSPAGVTANRYTVNNDKFIAAVTTSRNAGIASPRIAFKVPDSERAAIVAINLIALEMASKQGGDVTFAVDHNGATFELSLRTLNFAELSAMAGGNGISNHLLIAIDQGANNKTSSLSTALNSSKAQVIEGPVSFETFVVNGATKAPLTNFSGYVSRTLKTSSSVNTGQSAAVWLDPVTGTLSYVPTTFKTENGVTRATFKRKGNSAYALVKNTSSFSDMGTHWAAGTVQMMARKFIVEGHTVSKYDPDKAITRGEFATYIAKGLGLTGDRTAAAKFKDVNKDTVMGAYIGAASAAGIVNGVSGTSFKPNDSITRQDMATMLMRAAKVAGLSVSLPNSTDSYLQGFSDKSKVSSYAKTNVAQAIYLGIINGKTNTTLSPTTNASRAEGAVMIMRLLVKADFLTP
ncbi:Ig-like domain-containing protein [Paenibacillus sp. LHD-117]|uniref:Ig-like domain-containing protein n=1 Tax=Paenibacillus sp. LHD-117 TaxID=3071412 RepID=UPI0027DFFF90|nr:Ig-like domain-containing protein [Paenibacillus sp. LHD-117]MDQ6420911.1 Ig-like domain-containing protein [Paenibacillus sp. LHD-117]